MSPYSVSYGTGSLFSNEIWSMVLLGFNPTTLRLKVHMLTDCPLDSAHSKTLKTQSPPHKGQVVSGASPSPHSVCEQAGVPLALEPAGTDPVRAAALPFFVEGGAWV